MKNFDKAGVGLLLSLLLIMSENSWADPVSNFIRNNIDGSQTLMGHVPEDVRNGKARFHHHASQNIEARIIMPLQNQAQLSGLLKDLYDPKSPNFHRFITPDQFTQQFGPSAIDVQEVQEFFNKQGISVTGSGSNALKVTGHTSAFEHALGLHINYYQKTDGTMFFAPDADPTIPPTLAGKILAIGGLDNLAKYQAHSHRAPLKTLTNTAISKGSAINSAAQPAGGTGPGGYLAPNDVKTAYNLNSVPANGTGQTIALFELDGYTSDDITAYETQFGLPQVPLQNIFIDGFGGTPNYYYGGGADEVTLDIELLAAFAPGTSNILVYEALNTNLGWIDEWSQMASDNKAKIISCSWGQTESDDPTISFDNEIFQQMAAQGQAVFVAAGDAGAYVAGTPSDEPAVQPYVTAVGISTLSTNLNRTYNNETASIYGGGGISLYQSIPSYQAMSAVQAVPAAMVSLSMRNVPDVVLTADASTSYAFYIDGNWSGYYGSSLATPIWAAFMSLVNQGLGSNGPLGFPNPQLYNLAQTSNYTNDFHDIIVGNNGYYPAEPGFSDATGLGSFNGYNLYNDLVSQNAGSGVAPAVPADLSAAAGNVEVALTWDLSAGATSYTVARATVSGGPYVAIGTSKSLFYIDHAVSKNTVYYYVVSAINAKGQSANSQQVSATPEFVLPTAPSGVEATSGQIAQVPLSWDASDGAVSYNVKRAAVSGGPYIIIANTSDIQYVDGSVSNGTYYYVISAVNQTGESPNSKQVSAKPVISAPLAPLDLFAIEGNAQVTLFWSPSAGAASYIIKRATVKGGPYTTIASSTSTISSGGYPEITYSDNSVSNGTTYYYVVLAVNSIGQSPISKEVSTSPAALLTPVGLKVAWSDTDGIVLTWDASPGAAGYVIKRSPFSGGPYDTIALTFGNTFTDNPSADLGISSNTVYYYVVSATNASGQQQSPNSAQVSITTLGNLLSSDHATIVVEPADAIVNVGQTATFSVVAVPAPGLKGTFTYQWYKNSGNPIPGATGASYTTPPVMASDNGAVYQVLLNGDAGFTRSRYATLVVNTPPKITTQPSDVTVNTGQTATFSVVASGQGTLTYQWYKGTSGILKATGPSYTTPALTTADNGGLYQVKVSNSAGGYVYSRSALVTVDTPPIITTSPASQTVNFGQAVTLSGTATGAPPLSYQWQKNGVIIPGANNPSYTIPSASLIDIGNYLVVVSNLYGSATSNQASLQVLAPVLTIQPANQTVKVGQTATFSVTVPGSPPVTYQWQKNGVNIPGAIGATYTISSVSVNDAGAYLVVVKGAGWVTNASASLQVQAPITIISQPANQAVDVGHAATFSVVVQSNAPVTYQWQKNGSNILGATTASYTIASVSNNDIATYSVIVSNQFGGIVISSGASLTVNWPPTFTTQPVSQTIGVGSTATFLAAATGTPTPTYQWQKNGANITGATGQSYTTPTASAGDSGTIYTVVANNAGGTVTSNQAYLTVDTYPVISTQPVNQTVNLGQTATFSAVVTGSGPLSYQWEKNTMNIPGATGTSYTTPATTAADNGANYMLIVTNPAARVDSNAAYLTVNILSPTISIQPNNQAVYEGQTATFSVTATGTAPLSYQWQRNGTNISGATNALYMIKSVSVGDAGSYSVIVTNPYGSKTSNAATLTVDLPPAIIIQPNNQTVLNLGQGTTLSVVATGTAPLSYQWQKGGTNISGATQYYLQFNSVSVGDAGSYTVVVSNPGGSVTSSVAILAVNVPVTITTQPANQTVNVGKSATFSVVATGTAPITYQWQKNGANISGATGAYYTIDPVSVSDSGSYAVIVANPVGSKTSNAATLTIPVTFTTEPSSHQTVGVGQSATFNVAVTGTAPISYQWQKNGTNIAGATSASYTTPATSASDNATFYTVVVTNPAGSATSNQALLSVESIAPPTTPTNFTAVPSSSSITLTWTPSSPITTTYITPTSPVTSYIIKRGTTSGSYTSSVTITASAAKYTDTSVTEGITYYYVIEAENAGGLSTASTPISTMLLPAAPKNLSAVPGTKKITLNWTAGSGAISYIIKRGTASGVYSSTFAVSGGTTTSYTDSSVSNNTLYYYVVEAVNPSGSIMSAQVSAKLT